MRLRMVLLTTRYFLSPYWYEYTPFGFLLPCEGEPHVADEQFAHHFRAIPLIIEERLIDAFYIGAIGLDVDIEPAIAS